MGTVLVGIGVCTETGDGEDVDGLGAVATGGAGTGELWVAGLVVVVGFLLPNTKLRNSSSLDAISSLLS